MGRILDYSFARPDPARIKNEGYEGVVRYVSPNVSSGKNLDTGERDRLRGQGLSIGLVFEWYAERPKEGFAAGAADAQVALAQANALGFPDDRPIYAAVDWDATEGQQGAINEYMKGYQSVLGNRGRAAYGGYYIIKRLFEAGLIDYGWQTYAWSGGQWYSKAQLRQVLNGQWGGSVDFNESTASDWGQWGAQVPVTPNPQPNPSPAPTVDGDYLVKSGDTLGGLAAAWGTTVGAIVAANQGKYPTIGTGKNALVGAGWTIRRPGTVPPASVSNEQYVVPGGSNLGTIAKMWGTSVQAIIDTNKGRYPNIGTGSNALVGAGWVLNKPGGGAAPAAPAPAPAGRTHTVARGETLGAIGGQYGVDWHRIVDENKGRYPTIGNPPDDHVEYGWILTIPN